MISLEDQSDISALIEEKFDAFNLVPPDISPTVDLSHVGTLRLRNWLRY